MPSRLLGGLKTTKVWSRFASTVWGSGRTLRMKYDQYSTLDDISFGTTCRENTKSSGVLLPPPLSKFTRFHTKATRKHFRYVVLFVIK